MRRISAAFVAALMLSTLVATTPIWADSERRDGQSRRELALSRLPQPSGDEVLVQFKKGVDGRRARRVHARAGTQRTQRIRGLGIDVVRAPKGADLDRTMDRYVRSPLVAHVESNLYRRVDEAGPVFPNDPQFVNQWGSHNTGQAHDISYSTGTAAGTFDADVDFPEAWEQQQGSPDTVIAILDTGVDVTHPDIAPNLWINPDEIPGNEIDDDANGFVDDIHGWDFGDGNSSLLEPVPSVIGREHGTHVAGIAAAAMNNSAGIAGACPGCKIMVLKFFTREGNGMVGGLAAELEAIDYAIEMGADIINGSFGGPIFWSKLERAALRKAGRKGILSVLAAGNENGDNDAFAVEEWDGDDFFPESVSPNFPSSYNLGSILAVAASNHTDENAYDTACFQETGSGKWPCAFTSWGNQSVDVSAPGVDIISTVPGNDYEVFDGTSMAAPFVAGIAGLVKSANPGYSPVQIKNAIMNSVGRPDGLDRLGAFPGKFRTGRFTRTNGRVNALAALTAPTTNKFPATDGNINGARSIRASKSDWVVWPNDVNDVFKKRLRRGVRYRVVLDIVGRGDLDLWVWRPGTKEIWQQGQGCFRRRPTNCAAIFALTKVGSGDEGPRSFEAPKTGKYFFQVTAYLREKGSYTLRIKKL